MTEETPASNIVYNLVAVQYHALKASQLYDLFIADAKGNPDVVKFFKQCKTQDDKRALQAHTLLGALTSDGDLDSETPAPKVKAAAKKK